MTTEHIRRLHHAKPFRPFTIHLADGTSVTVNHPENMMQSQGGRTIIVNVKDEEMAIIDLLLVTKVTFAQNGTTAPRKRK